MSGSECHGTRSWSGDTVSYGKYHGDSISNGNTMGIVEIVRITKWVLIIPKGMYLVPRIYGKSMESL